MENQELVRRAYRRKECRECVKRVLRGKYTVENRKDFERKLLENLDIKREGLRNEYIRVS